MQKSLWLSISLFSCRSNWHTILSTGIAPFLAGISDKRYLNCFHIEFNYYCGENIRLSLLTKSVSAESLAKNTDDYFKHFFSSTKLVKKEVKLPVDGVFMPFPSNTIQYGLYPVSKTDDQENFRKILSELIIEALGDETIDEETLLMFAFYLHISMLKVMTKLNADIEKQVDQLYKTSHKDGAIDIRTLSEKFEDNKEILVEIYFDIMSTGPIENVPVWLEKWMRLCESEIRNTRENDSVVNIAYGVVIRKMSFAVDKQLGITGKMKLLLCYFIEQTFAVSRLVR